MLRNDEPIETEDLDARRWGAIAHVSAILPFPFFDLLGPFIIMITKGDQSEFVRRQAISAFNFRLTVLIGVVISWILIPIGIGLLLWGIVALGSMCLTFIGAIKASEGRTFQFPITLSVLK